MKGKKKKKKKKPTGKDKLSQTKLAEQATMRGSIEQPRVSRPFKV